MRIRGFFIFLVILLTVIVVVLLGDCGKPSDSEVAALVNGEPVTFGDVRSQVQEANRQLEFHSRISPDEEPFPEQLPAEYLQLVWELGYDPDELTEHQHRIVQGISSTYWDKGEQSTPLAEAERRSIRRQLRWMVQELDYLAFNELVRNRVLYQEAVLNGHQVSLDETHLFPDERDDLWKSMLGSAGLKEQFNVKLSLQHPAVPGRDFPLLSENAWEDYTEYLLRQADIEIRKGGFELEFFGEEWPHGRWDLR